MKKLFLLTASLILIGAGCSAATPATTPQTNTGNDNQNVTQSPAPTTTVASGYTVAQVAVNNSPAKCWTIINGNVYDVTAYAPRHPGGADKVYATCGKDGSSLFNGKHGGQEKPAQMLSKLLVGKLIK